MPSRDDDVRALGDNARRGRAAVGGLPGPRLSQDRRRPPMPRLAVTLYGFLMREGTIPTDWFAAQVAQADRTDGDIDTLSNRIAHIRTWTFAANRPDWLADPEHWQGVTRGVEDKLVRRAARAADRALRRPPHQRVDAAAAREHDARNRNHERPAKSWSKATRSAGSRAFSFAADSASARSRRQGAARRRAEGARRRDRCARRASSRRRRDDQFVLASDGSIRWLGERGRQARRRAKTCCTRACASSPTSISPARRATACRRGSISGSRRISKSCSARCSRSPRAEDITGIARGVAFQLVEALGVLERQKVAEDVKGLDQAARATLAQIRRALRRLSPLSAALLKPAPRALATQLWALKEATPETKGLDDVPHLAASRPHVDPGRQGRAEGALSHRRLPRLRRARGARRYSGAARRSHPSGAGLARRARRRRSRPARSRAAASPSRST